MVARDAVTGVTRHHHEVARSGQVNRHAESGVSAVHHLGAERLLAVNDDAEHDAPAAGIRVHPDGRVEGPARCGQMHDQFARGVAEEPVSERRLRDLDGPTIATCSDDHVTVVRDHRDAGSRAGSFVRGGGGRNGLAEVPHGPLSCAGDLARSGLRGIGRRNENQ